jgi:hypothetical protein
MFDKPLSPTERGCGHVLRLPTARSRDWTGTFPGSARSNRNIVAVVAVGAVVPPGVPTADLADNDFQTNLRKSDAGPRRGPAREVPIATVFNSPSRPSRRLDISPPGLQSELGRCS